LQSFYISSQYSYTENTQSFQNYNLILHLNEQMNSFYKLDIIEIWNKLLVINIEYMRIYWESKICSQVLTINTIVLSENQHENKLHIILFLLSL
jgi:hypothetical protein